MTQQRSNRMILKGMALALALGLLWGCAAAGGSHPHLGKVEHVVMFKFKEGTSADKITELEQEFAALRDHIPQIAAFEFGTNMSPEGIDLGYTHCFIVTFNTVADRDAYLPHPAHKKYVELLMPHLDEVHVIDFVARD